MNSQAPLLPETSFQPLSDKKLNAMIDHALTHRQLPRQAQVIAFRPWQKLAYSGGLTAMAASIMLAFMLTPQGSFTSVASSTASESTLSADVSDLLLLDSLGA